MGIEKKKEFIIYRIYHIDSGKSYIGITGNYERRMREHFSCYEKSYLHSAIKKYGKEKFIHEIIFECDSWEDLCKEETEYIKIFNTKVPNGYNLTDGGEGSLGAIVSLETRKKLSEVHKNPSVETRKKISDARKGCKLSVETRKKISEAWKNRQPMSDETRKKISEASKGRKLSVETRKKMSDAQKNMSVEIYKKRAESNKGKKRSLETCKKISEAKKNISVKRILEIRKMLKQNISQKIIAEKLSVVQGTVSNIKLNKRHYAEIQLPKE